MSKGCKKFYISFVDDFSKDEAVEMLLKYKAKVENQLDKKN